MKALIARKVLLLLVPFAMIALGFFAFGRFNQVKAATFSPGYWDAEVHFCSSNSGTNWETAYHFIWGDGSVSPIYHRITTSYIPGNATCYPATNISGELTFGLYFPGPEQPQIGYYTQCIDPWVKPNGVYPTASAIVWVNDVTYAGGNNLGTVPATDSSGASCPVGGGTTPPGPFLPNTSPDPAVTCLNATTQRVQFYWGASSGADSYTINWTSDGSDPRYSNSAASVSGVSSGYYNDTFSLGGHTIYWDVKAVNSGGSTWTSLASGQLNGYYSFQTKTSAQCAGPTPTPTPTSNYTLTVSISPNSNAGKVAISGYFDCGNGGSDCTQTFASGTNIGFGSANATAASGYSFSGYSGAGCSGGTSCTVSMNADKTITASFTSSGTPSCSWSPPGPLSPGGSSTLTNRNVPSGYSSGLNTFVGTTGTNPYTFNTASSTWTNNIRNSSGTIVASCSISTNAGGGGGGSCSWSPAGPITAGSQSKVTWSLPTGGGSAQISTVAGTTFISGTANTETRRFDSASTTWTFNVRNSSSTVVASCSISTSGGGSAPTANITVWNGSSYVDGPVTIASGSVAYLYWLSANATSCSVSPGGWTGTTGTPTTPELTTSTTYTVTCSKAGYANATDSVTVNVAAASWTVSATGGCYDTTGGKVDYTFFIPSSAGSWYIESSLATWNPINSGNPGSGLTQSGTHRVPWGSYSFGNSGQIKLFSGTSPSGALMTSANFTVPSAAACGIPPPSALSVATPACSSSTFTPTFTWSGTASANWFINIDNNNAWAVAEANKAITGTSDNGSGYSGGFTFQPGVVYRWNIYYGEGSGASAKFVLPASTQYTGTPPASSPYVDTRPYLFSVPVCAPTNLSIDPLPACSNTAYSVTFRWSGVSTSDWGIRIARPGSAGVYNISAGLQTVTFTSPYGPGSSFDPGVTFDWSIRYQTTPTTLFSAAGPSFSVPLCAPSALNTSVAACPTPTVTFRWTGSATTSWAVNIRTDNAWGSETAFKVLNNGDVSTTNASGFIKNDGSGTAYTFTPGTYYWRMYYGVGGNWIYPASSSTPTGASFTIPTCAAGGLTVSNIICTSTSPLALTSNNFTVSWDSGSYFVQVWNAASGGSIVRQTSVAQTSGLTYPSSRLNHASYNGSLAANTQYWVGASPTSGVASGTRVALTVPICAPTGLSVSGLPSCAIAAGYGSTVRFAWTGAAGANWFVNIDNNTDWDNNNDNVAEADANQGITAGNSSITGGFTFLPNVTYRWNVYYGAGSGATAQFVIPVSVSVTNAQLIAGAPGGGAGYTFSVPGCLDLKARFNNTAGGFLVSGHQFGPGDPISLTVNVTNMGSGSSAATTVGLWTGQSGETAFPACTALNVGAGGAPLYSQPVGALAAGGTQPVTFSYPAPSSANSYIAKAYVIPACNQNDAPPPSSWLNNATGTGAVAGDYVGNFSYTVDVDGWFQTQGGDVGALGAITAQKAPPTCSTTPGAACNSQYLLVGGSTNTNIRSNKWKFTNSSGSNVGPLMPAATYTYLAERFLNKATNQGASCAVSVGLNKCTPAGGTWTFGGGAAPAGNSVVFVLGNLVITGNVTAPGSNTITFVVSGNITVNTNVSNLDGLYVAGGLFKDTDLATGISGPQLVANGSIYAGDMTLTRVLGGLLCGAFCNNTLYPAESFIFSPKYITTLGTLLGTPAVTWQEVAP